MQRRRWTMTAWGVWLVRACFGALTVAAIVLCLWALPSAAQDKVVLQLKWHHQYQFAGYYAAQKLGYFTEEGLDVEIRAGGPGISFVDEVTEGRAQYGVATAELILDYINDSPVKLVAAIFQHNPFVFIARSDSGIISPKDLVGRRVMVPSGLPLSLVLMLMKEGVSIQQLVLVPGSGQMDALADGSVDAVVAYSIDAPHALQKRGIPVTMLHPRDYGVDTYGDCLFTNVDEAQNHPERVRRMRRAVVRGWEYAVHHVDEMVEYIRERYLPNAQVQRLRYEAEILRAHIQPNIIPIGTVSPERLERLRRDIVSAGLVKPDVSLDGFVFPLRNELLSRHRNLFVGGLVVVGAGVFLLLWFNWRLKRGIARHTQRLEQANDMLLAEIGERAAAEDALRRSEAKFRALFDQTYQLCAIISPEGVVQMVNQTALDFVDDEAENIVGKPFWETPWWRHSEAERERVQEGLLLARQGRVIRDEAEHVDVRGELRVIDFSLKPISDSDGKVVYILAEGRDISERKRAAEESRRLRKVLQDVVDSLESMLVAVDKDLRLTLWNRKAVENMKGKPLRQGMTLQEVLPYVSPWLEFVHGVIASGVPYLESGVAVDHEERFVDLAMYPLAGGQGAVVHVDDVTERVRLQQMMIQTEKMMSVGGLAAGMAHEINNPLGIILQSGQNLRRRFQEDLPGNTRVAERLGLDLGLVGQYMEARGIGKYLDGIAEAGERAARIVSSMLKFSRRSEEDMSRNDLHDLLDGVLELAASDYDLKKKYDFKQIEIRREYADDLPRIVCSRNQMEQVFLNIVKNAAEALGEGTSDNNPPTISLRTGTARGAVFVAISDNGPGMDEATRRRVFEPFFTTKAPGQGTGLGLSVAYFIVTSTHNGVFRVSTRPGGGTVFTVELPVRALRDEEGLNGDDDENGGQESGANGVDLKL